MSDIVYVDENEYRDIIIIQATKLRKTPYCHLGRSSLGLDCLGYFWLAYRRSGIELPERDKYGYYNEQWWKSEKEERLLNQFSEFFDFTNNPQKGDAILFRMFKNSTPINHCAIYYNENSFLHCVFGRNGGVDFQVFTDKWMSRCVYYMKYKGFKEIDNV